MQYLGNFLKLYMLFISINSFIYFEQLADYMDENFIIAAFRALGEENVQNVKVIIILTILINKIFYFYSFNGMRIML